MTNRTGFNWYALTGIFLTIVPTIVVWYALFRVLNWFWTKAGILGSSYYSQPWGVF